MRLATISTIALLILVLSGCMHMETGRQIIVDLNKHEIAIHRRERVLALLTVEGPFPKTGDSAYVISRAEFPGKGQVRLTIPESAKARYGALESGQIDLDFDKKLAVVKVRPAAKYEWLDLDGEYPIVFGELWKGQWKPQSQKDLDRK